MPVLPGLDLRDGRHQAVLIGLAVVLVVVGVVAWVLTRTDEESLATEQEQCELLAPSDPTGWVGEDGALVMDPVQAESQVSAYRLLETRENVADVLERRLGGSKPLEDGERKALEGLERWRQENCAHL